MENATIRILSENVVGRIAAGEVVERPASVVKELLENAIDAHARNIEIEVKDGGQKLIEVTDDGIGMTRTDAVLAFTPHATSKIETDADLEKLTTLGFRGEALATIAAVSRVTMVTVHETSKTAVKIQIEGGRIVGVENEHFPRGTRIQVKNLFYNVPARRKFLKSPQSELTQISDIVCHYMMAYPELAFRFTKSNVLVAASTGSGNLIDAILAVYGPETAESMIPLEVPPALAAHGVKIRGFISPPNEPRRAARYMTTLINRRYVRSKLYSQAIFKALSAFFPKGSYPVLVFDMQLDPEMLDVNVHPQKTEVRFKDERLVFAAICETIQTGLSGLKMVAPSFPQTTGDNRSFIQQNFDEGRRNPGEFPESSSEFKSTMFPQMQQTPGNLKNTAPEPRIYDLKDDTERLGPLSLPGEVLQPVKMLESPKILAQLMNSYLLGEDKTGLFILDQHAAHERILFDTYQDAYRDTKITAQPLLFPIPLKLLPSEKAVVEEHFDQIAALGFTVLKEEDGLLYVSAVPILGAKGEEGEISNMLTQILGDWGSRTSEDIKTDLLKMMACKAAVKAGDPLEPSEMKSLLDQLLKTANPFTCPHGRPIVIRLTRRTIDKGFLRI